MHLMMMFLGKPSLGVLDGREMLHKRLPTVTNEVSNIVEMQCTVLGCGLLSSSQYSCVHYTYLHLLSGPKSVTLKACDMQKVNADCD